MSSIDTITLSDPLMIKYPPGSFGSSPMLIISRPSSPCSTQYFDWVIIGMSPTWMRSETSPLPVSVVALIIIGAM